MLQPVSPQNTECCSRYSASGHLQKFATDLRLSTTQNSQPYKVVPFCQIGTAQPSGGARIREKVRKSAAKEGREILKISNLKYSIVKWNFLRNTKNGHFDRKVEKRRTTAKIVENSRI